MVVEHIGGRFADVKRARGIGVVAPVNPADIDIDLLAVLNLFAARQRVPGIGLQTGQHR